ncbi:MAG TPA: hypothetical protein VHW96_15020 [Solirubrobacteraceae bacterium]|jgi:hypothetical protein|nr:hypothetical protein [Solirubrobacteraceae bacterium]
MRVAWVHPTWRDLVIERLAGDAKLRRHFLGHCGPHGIALALSTWGGAEGERQLPLIAGDEDWDAIGDRLYALAPELEAREAVTVLVAVDQVLEAVLDDAMLAGESAALASMVLERFGELWDSAHTPVALSCIDAWLSVSARLNPPPWPTFLSVTWAELLPTELPDPHDLPEMQRFTDWMTLVELAAGFSPDLLGELGYSPAQGRLRRAFTDRARLERERRALTGEPPAAPVWDIEESRAQRISDNVIRRVLVDL